MKKERTDGFLHTEAEDACGGAVEAVLEGGAEGLEWKAGVGEVANEAVEVGVEVAEGKGCEDGEAGGGGRGARRSGEGGSH